MLQSFTQIREGMGLAIPEAKEIEIGHLNAVRTGWVSLLIEDLIFKQILRKLKEALRKYTRSVDED